MDADSLRVDIVSPSLDVGLVICDVNVAVVPEHPKTSRHADNPELDALSDEQKVEYTALARRKDLLMTRIATLEKSAGLFHGYADNLLRSRTTSTPAPGTTADATATHAHASLPLLENLDEFVAVYPEKLQALLEKHQDAQEKLDGVQKDIDDLLEKGRQIRAKNPDADWFVPPAKPTVTIVLESDIAREAEVLVSYRVYFPNMKT